MTGGASSRTPECILKAMSEDSVYEQLSQKRVAELCHKGGATIRRPKMIQLIRLVVHSISAQYCESATEMV